MVNCVTCFSLLKMKYRVVLHNLFHFNHVQTSSYSNYSFNNIEYKMSKE